MSKSIQEIPVKRIDGSDASLGDFGGSVLLVVNVASKCGLTPQYEGLESIYETYHDKGFEVLGFPANNFAGQEPGTNDEIQSFCQSTYGVKFPMFSKSSVTGDDRHPLYDALIEAKPDRVANAEGKLRGILDERGLGPKNETDIMWNFEKFLIGRNGEVIERFAPDVAPDDLAVKKAIEAALDA